MKKNPFLLLSLLLAMSCVNSQNKEKDIPCPEGINLLPMYGEVQKCKAQLASDAAFLEGCDKQYSSRQEASKVHVGMAWDYMSKGDLETMIKRFNQTWMLDSLNSEVYWGFGVVSGARKQTKEAKRFFEKSLKLNPNRAEVWYCLAVSYRDLYHEEKSEKDKEKMIEMINKAIELNPNYYPTIQLMREEKLLGDADEETTIVISPGMN